MYNIRDLGYLLPRNIQIYYPVGLKTLALSFLPVILAADRFLLYGSLISFLGEGTDIL